MKVKHRNLKLSLVVLVCVIMAGSFFATEALMQQSTSGLSPQETRGRGIYLRGDAGQGPEIQVMLGDLDVPASTMTCAGCHGSRGEGKTEGGVLAPPLTWTALTRSSTGAGGESSGYTEQTFARSITNGVNSSGKSMAAAMPRYKMTSAQMGDLISYIKRLPHTPGVTDKVITVGAALPMTGTLAATGQAIKAALAASFDDINSQGGAYGRRFELVVEDSKGEAAETLAATRRLVDQDGAFVIVGSFLPDGGKSIGQYVWDNEVAVVGPSALSLGVSSPPNPYLFYFQPTFSDQARSLLDFARSRTGEGARIAVAYSETDISRDALEGLRTQAQMYSIEIVAEHSYKPGAFAADKAVESLIESSPDNIFFLGSPSGDIDLFAREMERAELDVTLLGLGITAGPGLKNLPAGIASRTFLSLPAAPPTQDESARFVDVMKKSGAAIRNQGSQIYAYAASRVLFEAVKLAGKQLDRTTLLGGLERIQNLRTGVIPPISFGPDRKVGSTGSIIVGIDPAKHQLVPVTGNLVPKEIP